MDLALQTGWPLPVIARMTERELRLWDRYAQQKGFPMRRLEYGLARVTQMIAATMGGNSEPLGEYLFPTRAEEDVPMTDDELAALKAEIGFKPD